MSWWVPADSVLLVFLSAGLVMVMVPGWFVVMVRVMVLLLMVLILVLMWGLGHPCCLDRSVLCLDGVVLRGDDGGDREFLCAEIVAWCGKHRVGTLGEDRFEGADGGVGYCFEFGVRDAFFDVRATIENDRDAFALEYELDIRERRTTMTNKIRGTSEGSIENGGGRDSTTHVRCGWAPRGVRIELCLVMLSGVSSSVRVAPVGA